MNRGQISTEYMIVIAFVMFVVLMTMGVALYYSSQIQDSIRFSQLERFSRKVISTAESVHYDGEPSRAVITAYLPAGIQNISISGNDILVVLSTHSGVSRVSYTSAVPLSGSISSDNGVKRITIRAVGDAAVISST